MSVNKDSDPVRKQVLQKALSATMGDRNKAYGDPSINMGLAARLKDMYRAAAGGRYSKAHDASIEMVLLKIARIATGAIGHTDNYVDGAAYMAIAAECQASADTMKALVDGEPYHTGDHIQNMDAEDFYCKSPIVEAYKYHPLKLRKGVIGSKDGLPDFFEREIPEVVEPVKPLPYPNRLNPYAPKNKKP